MKWRENIVRGIFFICACSSIGIAASLIYFLFSEGWNALSSWVLNGFGMSWDIWGKLYGIIPLIYSTLYVALGATLFASIIGILSGVYLAEYADQRVRNAIKPGLEMLSGVPSIVLGLFGATIIAAFTYVNTGASTSILACWIALGVLVLPAMTSLTEDSIRSVPNGYKEASLALGATRWQTTYKVVIPAARSGIVNGVLLTLGRAAGEVMVVLFVSGGQAPLISLDPLRGTRTITTVIATSMGEGGFGSFIVSALYGMGFILLLLIGMINLIILLTTKRAAPN